MILFLSNLKSMVIFITQGTIDRALKRSCVLRSKAFMKVLLYSFTFSRLVRKLTRLSFLKKNILYIPVIIILINNVVFAVNNSSTQKKESVGVLCQKDNRINTAPYAYDPIGSKYGIDISEFQGMIDWEMVFIQCIDFVFVRATEGITIQDKYYGENITTLTKNNFLSGPYHFFVIGDDPKSQVDNFIKQIITYDTPTLAPVIDIEEASFAYSPKLDKKQIQASLLKVLNLVEQGTGCSPIIYTNTDFANKYLDNPLLSKFKLWLADYNPIPITPITWMEIGYSIHQYKTYNPFPGISDDKGQLDLNKGFVRMSSFEEEFMCEYIFQHSEVSND